MTLCELSCCYQADAEAFGERIAELRKKAREGKKTGGCAALERRIAELRQLRRQSRELAELTKRYYERGYYRNEKYVL